MKSTGLLERLVDLLGERLDDRRRRALEAGAQVAGADHRLEHRREHALGLDDRRRRRRRARRRRGAQQLRHAELLRDRAAGRPRDRLGADLRQPPGAEVLGLQARVEVRGDRQREHAVAEERQPRVGVAAARRPRRVREDLPVEVLRQLVEQFA